MQLLLKMKEDDLKMPQMEAPPGNSSETLDKDKSRRMKVSGAINKIMSSDTTGIVSVAQISSFNARAE